jgi:Leucine-rich repeat (LRR) protein
MPADWEHLFDLLCAQLSLFLYPHSMQGLGVTRRLRARAKLLLTPRIRLRPAPHEARLCVAAFPGATHLRIVAPHIDLNEVAAAMKSSSITSLDCNEQPWSASSASLAIPPMPHSLREISFSLISVDDIRALGSLDLRSLSLRFCFVRDVRPISSLVRLTALDLGYCSVVDIGPLSPLTALKDLSLRYCDVVDISPVSSLVRLHTLDLANTDIVDLKPLSTLTALTKLDLASCHALFDLDPLAALGSLRCLSIYGCIRISCNARALRSLTALRSLSAHSSILPLGM